MTMPIEKNGKKIKICSLAALAVAALAIILRTACLLWFYDKEIGYYTRDILPAAFEVLCVLAILLFAGVFFLVKPSDKTSDGKEDTPAIKISSVLAMFAFSAFFVSLIISTSLLTGNAALDLVLKLSSLVSIVYFAMNLFVSHVNRTLQTALGFAIIIWEVCVLAITYFDIYVQLNSPEKVILHLALVSGMAFFTSEFRCFVSSVKSKIYLFSAFCSVFFSGACSVPFIIAYVSGAINGGTHLFYNTVMLAVFVYSATRLVSFAFAELKCEEAQETEVGEEDLSNI